MVPIKTVIVKMDKKEMIKEINRVFGKKALDWVLDQLYKNEMRILELMKSRDLWRAKFWELKKS